MIDGCNCKYQRNRNSGLEKKGTGYKGMERGFSARFDPPRNVMPERERERERKREIERERKE